MADLNGKPRLLIKLDYLDANGEDYTDAILFLLEKKFPNFWNEDVKIVFEENPLQVHHLTRTESQDAFISGGKQMLKWLTMKSYMDHIPPEKMPEKLITRLIVQNRIDTETLEKMKAGEYAGEYPIMAVEVTEHDISEEIAVSFDRTYYLFGEERKDWELGNNWIRDTREVFKTKKV